MLKSSTKVFLFYSVLLHGLLGLLLMIFNNVKQRKIQTQQSVSIELLEVVPKSNKKSKTELLKKTIVDQDKINNEIDPIAKYLSSHNQKVMKETVSKNNGEFRNKKIRIQSVPQKQVKSSNEKSKRFNLPKDLFGSYKDSIAKSLEKQRIVDQNQLQNGSDISQTRDYLPGKEAGLETLLSTKEFVYYTYYSRIRNQLSQYWEPKIKQKVLAMFRQGRRIASTEDRITKVQSVLNSEGVLVKARILGQSGVRDLDDIAVEAFRAAAPFPNPPKGIIESDGTVKIDWDFVIET